MIKTLKGIFMPFCTIIALAIKRMLLPLVAVVALALSPAAFAARPFVGIAGIEYAAPGSACGGDSLSLSGGGSCVSQCVHREMINEGYRWGKEHRDTCKVDGKYITDTDYGSCHLTRMTYSAANQRCTRQCKSDSARAESGNNRNACFNNVVNGFTKMLETAIVKTNKMAVYDREQLDPVFAEQLAGQAGLTNRGGKLGGLDGVDYIVSGSITKFGGKQEESGISGEVLGLFGSGRGQGLLGQGVQQAKATWEMAVDIKIIDVSTGQIVAAETVESHIIAASASNIAGLQSGEQKADYLSDVQRSVAREVAALIVQQKFPIRAISVSDGVISLNYNDSVLSVGDCLNIYALGEGIIDPDTGESLGQEEVLAGAITVVETNNKFSKAEADGGFTPKKGMIARKKECTESRAAKSAPPKKDDRREVWNDK
ncbi:MAG: CsgG/HfaB family protein [Gammaproteobacteria bacterium]